MFRLPEASSLDDILILAAELAQALPTHPLQLFRKALRHEGIEDGISQTETVRAVRQRVGQDIYRKGLMQYWGSACAITGIALPEVLRASHARPWAECDTDAQRLDVFNGFLLNANLDALFDRGLISFDAVGKMLLSSKISEVQLQLLGLSEGLKLRWIAPEHQCYLEWHRMNVFT